MADELVDGRMTSPAIAGHQIDPLRNLTAITAVMAPAGPGVVIEAEPPKGFRPGKSDRPILSVQLFQIAVDDQVLAQGNFSQNRIVDPHRAAGAFDAKGHL